MQRFLEKTVSIATILATLLVSLGAAPLSAEAFHKRIITSYTPNTPVPGSSVLADYKSDYTTAYPQVNLSGISTIIYGPISGSSEKEDIYKGILFNLTTDTIGSYTAVGVPNENRIGYFSATPELTKTSNSFTVSHRQTGYSFEEIPVTATDFKFEPGPQDETLVSFPPNGGENIFASGGLVYAKLVYNGNNGGNTSFSGTDLIQQVTVPGALAFTRAARTVEVNSLPRNPGNVNISVTQYGNRESYSLVFRRVVPSVSRFSYLTWTNNNRRYRIIDLTQPVCGTYTGVLAAKITRNNASTYSGCYISYRFGVRYSGKNYTLGPLYAPAVKAQGTWYTTATTPASAAAGFGWETPTITGPQSEPFLVTASSTRPSKGDIVSLSEPRCTYSHDCSLFKCSYTTTCTTNAISADGRIGAAHFYSHSTEYTELAEILAVGIAIVTGGAVIGGLVSVLTTTTTAALLTNALTNAGDTYLNSVAPPNGGESVYGTVADTISNPAKYNVGTWTWTPKPVVATSTPICTNGATTYPACNKCPENLGWSNGKCVPCDNGGCTGPGGSGGGGNGGLKCNDGATNPLTCDAFKPTAALIATPTTVSSGNAATLTWSSTNAVSCTGTGFSTKNATSNKTGVSTGPLTHTETYQITCKNSVGAKALASATVTVLTPDATISAKPSRVQAGETSTITWSSAAVKSCTVTGPNGKISTSLSGSKQVTVNALSTYTITCQKKAVSKNPTVSQSTTITIVPKYNQF